MHWRARYIWAVGGVAAGVLLGFVLFGGDGSDEGSNQSSAAQIEQLLARVMTEGDPAQCAADFTPAFLHQSYGDEPGTDTEACRRDNLEDHTPTADSVDVNRVA